MTLGKLTNAVQKFNSNRPSQLEEIENLQKENMDNVTYLKEITKILKKYNLDSQGFCEYVRITIGKEECEPEIIWKEVKGGKEKRYTRCLIYEYDSKKYLLDSVDQTVEEVNIENIDKKTFIFNPEENEYTYYGG